MTEDAKQMTDDGRQVTGDPARRISSPPSPVPHYEFQGLDVYQLGLDYLDKVSELARGLPEAEKYNLRSQLERAATSIVLNIAEGSTSQSDPEQNRFIAMAIRSYLETVACLDIALRRQYSPVADIRAVREPGHELFVKLQALRRSLSRPKSEDR